MLQGPATANGATDTRTHTSVLIAASRLVCNRVLFCPLPYLKISVENSRSMPTVLQGW